MPKDERTEELVVVEVQKYKRVKQALQQSEERFKSLFMNVPVGMFRVLPDGRMVDANPAMISILGFESFGEIGKINFIEEPNLPVGQFDELTRILVAGGVVRGQEIMFRNRQGATVYGRLSISAMRDPGGGILYVEGTLEDITAQRRQEELTRRRTQDMEILNELISSGNRAPDVNLLLEVILEVTVGRMHFDGGGIYLLSEDNQYMELRSHRHLDPAFVARVARARVGDTPYRQVLDEGGAIFHDDFEKVNPALFASWQYHTLASVPLVAGGRILGAINVASLPVRPITEDDRNLLMLIGREGGTLVSRLRAENLLRDSEESYRMLVETSPDGILLIDLQGYICMVNRRFTEMVGEEAVDLVGRRGVDLLVPEDLPAGQVALGRMLEESAYRTSQYRILRKDGGILFVEVGANILNDTAGRRRGIIINVRDIGWRLEAERALRKSEAEYRTLVETSPYGIMKVDLRGNVVMANQRILETLGRTADEVLDRPVFTFLMEGDVAEAQARFVINLQSGRFSIHEYEVRRADGTLCHLEAGAVLEPETPVKPGRVIIYCRDIGDRLEAERALRESEELFRTTFEAIADPAYLWERQSDGRVVLARANRAGYAITDGHIEAYLGFELRDLYRDRPDLIDCIGQVLETGFSAQREMRYGYYSVKKELWLLVDVVRTSEQRVMVITKDITELKRKEEQLLQYQEQLRALTVDLARVGETERRRVASELHDGVAQNLALCKMKLNALKSRWHGRIPSDWNEVSRLLEQSIQETRSLVFDLSPPVLYELGLLAATQWLAERMTEQSGVAIDVQALTKVDPLPDDLRVFVFQVLRELLFNAVKHARARRIVVVLRHDPERLQLTVSDDGVGVDPAAPAGTKGFGLFSVRERLRYVGGGMEMTTAPKEGTTVVVQVPMALTPGS